jgi:hypothetical protein
MKKVSEKYTYIWTILSGIPFGIGMLIGAYTTFNSISRNTYELVSNSGQIIEYGNKDVYHKGIDATISVYEIKLKTGIYQADIGKRIKLLEQCIPNAFETKKNITIWTEKSSSSIEQLAIDDQIVLPYKPPYWQAWTFLIIGIVFTGMGTIYLIKYFKSTWLSS